MKPSIDMFGKINKKEVSSIKNYVIMERNTTNEGTEKQDADAFQGVLILPIAGD